MNHFRLAARLRRRLLRAGQLRQVVHPPEIYIHRLTAGASHEGTETIRQLDLPGGMQADSHIRDAVFRAEAHGRSGLEKLRQEIGAIGIAVDLTLFCANHTISDKTASKFSL